jgi:hypothetical protein
MRVSATLHPATALSDAVSTIIEAMCRAIAARAAKDVLRAPLLVLLFLRLRRLSRRLAGVAARAAAGTLRTLPRRRPAPAAPPRPRPPQRLPRSLAALVRLAPEAAGYGSQLRHLLSRPETAAALAEAPHLARYLRPLCGLLGVAPVATRPPPPPASAASPLPSPAHDRAAPPPPAVAFALRTPPPKRA